jgi:DNA repair photolyase
MRHHTVKLKAGITRSREFEKKRLASFAVNVGTKCGHGCRYCSSGAVLRMHRSFKEAGEDPFGFGYAIVDPITPERVARDARRLKKRGMVQLCTLTDAWSPEAKELELGRRCLEAILAEPGWTVRILTKNAAVREDFDLIERYQDRVLVGLSITGTAEKARILKVLEPNASPVDERMRALEEASRRGLRTYAMFCPLLPGIADTRAEIDRLLRCAEAGSVEEVFAEAVNPRGPGLRLCQEALAREGFRAESLAVSRIRRQKNWSCYTVLLIRCLQMSMRRHSDVRKLRFLLYPSGLREQDLASIRNDDEGVVWLGNGPESERPKGNAPASATRESDAE